MGGMGGQGGGVGGSFVGLGGRGDGPNGRAAHGKCSSRTIAGREPLPRSKSCRVRRWDRHGARRSRQGHHCSIHSPQQRLRAGEACGITQHISHTVETAKGMVTFLDYARPCGIHIDARARAQVTDNSYLGVGADDGGMPQNCRGHSGNSAGGERSPSSWRSTRMDKPEAAAERSSMT